MKESGRRGEDLETNRPGEIGEQRSLHTRGILSEDGFDDVTDGVLQGAESTIVTLLRRSGSS